MIEPDPATTAGTRLSALLRWLWPLYRKRWRTLLASLLLALAAAWTGIGLLGVAGGFLTATALVSGALASFNLFVPSATVRALAFLRILTRYGERVQGHAATLQLLADLRVRLFTRLLRLSPAQLQRWHDGDLVARLTDDIEALDSVFLLSLLPWGIGLLGSAALIALLALHLPSAALALAALSLLLLLLLPLWLAARARSGGQQRQNSLAALRQQVLQASEGHADLLALDATDRAEAELAASSQRLSQATLEQARSFALGQALLLALSGLAVLLVIVLGLPALREGRIGAVLFVGCVLAVAGMFELILPLLRGASRIGAAQAAGQRIRAIEDAPPAAGADADSRIDSEPGNETDSGAAPPLAAIATLRLQQLSFAYQPDLPVLERIDLEIPPGARIVISGTSGSGKSTLFALLLRLLEPDSGTLHWGEVELRLARLQTLHQRIALLSQDAPVFMGSVRANLLMADAEADDARLWAVLEQVGLAAEIRALPEGLGQWLGEGGRTLSAGQARRLCLARTLLSPASLLLLDEPTEGLDAQAERAFLRNLPHILQGRSLLLATHADVPEGVADAHWRLEGGRLLRLD